LRLTWTDGVVPGRADLMPLQAQAPHLDVGYLHLRRVGRPVQARRHPRSADLRPPDPAGLRPQAPQRLARPVAAHRAEEPLLHRVPLRGPGRIMAGPDVKTGAVGRVGSSGGSSDDEFLVGMRLGAGTAGAGRGTDRPHAAAGIRLPRSLFGVHVILPETWNSNLDGP
jgi:hypothetical protein